MPHKDIRFTHDQYAAIKELMRNYPMPMGTFADAIRAMIARQAYLLPDDIERVAATFRTAEPPAHWR